EIAYTAATRRTHGPHRLGLAAVDAADARRQLEAFVAGTAGVNGVAAQKVGRPAPRVAFVFTGQGPQWHAMGRDLLEMEPAFAAALRRCDALLRAETGWSLVEELRRGEEHSRMEDTSVAQPAIFALQVALAALWRSWGIEPDVVVGHSVGE